MKKAIVIHFRLEPNIFYKVKEIAEKESRTVASIFRQATKEFLENKTKKLSS